MTTNLIISLRYKSYDYFSQDTNDKYVLYKILNNYNQSPGYCKVSKNTIYYNESVNHSDPYVKTHGGIISAGFVDCSTMHLNAGNKFNGDTLFLTFHVVPVSGPQFDTQNSYLKQ